MPIDPRDWDPSVDTAATPPDSEYGLVSRLVTDYGPNHGKDPYPDDMNDA